MVVEKIDVHGNRIPLLDLSELYRPEHKKESEFRRYTLDEETSIQKRVRETYRLMHANQTVDFVKQRMEHWCKFDKFEMDVMQALETLNVLVDESDPDVDLPNIVHAFQTAERIREKHPNLDWFQLTGLIHDLGKIMALHGEPQWAVVGDTFPVGCEFRDSIVYRHSTFSDNPDLKNPEYNTKLGIYSENCGLKNVFMSWGHDEYLYRVLLNHKDCKLPEEALFVIRFHSFYPLHTGNDYQYLCDEDDIAMFPWLKEFNKFDLYSKSEDIPDIKQLMPYYQSLINKYIPGKVKW
ncbi:Inositol oxygenase-like protein [Dinothrombium tinctorium]|uniref:Inositol oxygenase n=1 Tax=Dinothrombium tinctorium TaxID=1965070 RepID=A0A443QGH8_9ACAR|nr:Inositol oxygenase-like protein [Dinothrombium tinctorium]RWS02107.1 Inositol oxygenase-like protein [Dinothrombium tinctorium]RWS02125.1 Inositol oxygenase-like protein [Dinothrombium tinctorium]